MRTFLSAVGVPAALLLTVVPASGADLGAPGLLVRDFRTMYVRGDVGIGQNSIGRVLQQDLADNGGAFVSKSFADTPYISAGLGWTLSSRFRLDLTGEYRAATQFKALDNLSANLSGPDGQLHANTSYHGELRSFVGLANLYFDIGTWRGVTPYVGGGIGFVHHRLSGITTQSAATFTDAVTGASATSVSTGFSRTQSQTNFAWALMAGASFDLSASAKLDIGYRYIDLGSGVTASSGALDCTCGTIGAPLRISDLHANEFRIGVRWLLGPTPHNDAPLK